MATAAAVLVAHARRRIVSRFEQAGATSSATAIGFEPRDRPIERRQFRQLLKQGVLIETAPGRYYLDLDGLARFRKAVGKRIAGVLAIGAAALAAVLAFG